MSRTTRPARRQALYALVALITVLLAPEIAAAQRVSHLEFVVRTGGDNLRGGNDNAFVRVRTTRGTRQIQLNAGNRELKNGSVIRRQLRVPAGTRLRDIGNLEIFVEGFRGGIGGDNWNVDGLRVFAVMATGGDELLLEENNARIRFTGKVRNWVIWCRFRHGELPCINRVVPR